MTETEAIKLCRLVKALCPAQPFDQYTPRAWAMILTNTRYEDAEAAVKLLYSLPLEGQWTRKIEASHILDQVRKTRNAKIDAYGPIEPPPDLHPDQYPAWLRQARTAIANGDHIEQPQLQARTMPNLAALTHRIDQ